MPQRWAKPLACKGLGNIPESLLLLPGCHGQHAETLNPTEHTQPAACKPSPEAPHHQHQEWGVLSHVGSISAAPTCAPASCQGLTARCLLLINRMSRRIISKAQFTRKWTGNSAACSGTPLICFHKAQGHGQHPQQPPVQPYSRNDTAELHQRKFSLRGRLSHSKVTQRRRELRLLNVA